jgi:hypothetical protein
MRDYYLLDLFTLRRADVLFVYSYNIDEFFYIFIMELWSEALENRHFPWVTRILILETLLPFFYVQYMLIIQGKTNPGSFRKSQNVADV